MAPGMIIKGTSTYNGQQYATKVYVYMDFRTQYWWFAVNTKDEVLGYWPSIIFNNFERASQALFGGYVYDANLVQPPMGSGHMPSEGVNKAAYIRTMKVLPGGGTPKIIEPEMLEVTKIGSDCYGIGTVDYRGPPFEYTFFYGGPGNC
ncbi:hypothetical protein QJS10_CPB17g02501 [Acorus calamus]|uniref:Neprosin PEP catalytic domain-containing protein n=1 Tax=Acorus calamus TaxID=4465 RepID=A0AAV9CVU0_ACOCL|nr:hypothetical protein QJS10_CPB17g02501 [Acorus calamus]